MQLVAYGAQDIYLTGNPQITFFKVVYRRHTNFSMETIEQTLNGTAGPGKTSTCTISRNGDLVHRMYVTSSADNITNGSEGLVSEAELEIGGQRIDKHLAEWMQVWNELSTPESKALALKSMQADIGTSNGSTGVGFVQVPLQFWFCRNPGLALPLIALQYHEVKIRVTWGSNGDENSGINCDYIYLDTDERRRFAQVSHEYLIEQVQREEKNTSSTTHKLNFNHPVKELIWTTDVEDDYGKANLKLNGHDRFALQDKEYFQLRQPYECHTAVPSQNLPSSAKLLQSQNTLETATNFGGVAQNPTTDLVNIAAFAAGLADNQFCITTSAAAANLVATDTTHSFTNGDSAYAAAVDAQTAAVVFNGDVALEFLPGPMILTGTNLGPNGNETKLIVNVLNVGPLGDSASVNTLAGTDRAVFFDRRICKLTGSSSLNGSYEGPPQITSVQKITLVPEVTGEARTSKMVRHINVYSFALKPEEHQPSGTCNFSRIDTAQLIFTSQQQCIVYAVNYNVLRIMSGMGGLAYSN